MSFTRPIYRQPRFVQQLARRRRLELTPVLRAARSVTERLEERTLLSSYTWNPGAGTLLIDLGTNEQMAISEAAGARTFHISSGTFIQNGGTAATGDGTSTINFAAADNIGTSITVNNAGDVAPSNESVSFLGGNLTSAAITVDLTQTANTASSILFTTTATNFSTSAVSLKSSNTINSSGGGAASATTGTLALSSVASIGSNATPMVTAVASLSAQSSAGGIFVTNTGAANIAFSALGDVSIANTGALTITTVGAISASSGGGTITVSTASPLTVNAPISDNGGDDITLQAGPFLSSNPADVLTINANVTASGGNGTINLNDNSLVVNAATISAIGAGNIFVQCGPGGSSTFNNGSTLTTVNGGIVISSLASATLNGTAALQATGTGGIELAADDVAIASTASISASDGVANGNNIVGITTETPGRPINLGSNTAGSLGLTDAELDRINAETLRIGSGGQGSGNIMLSSLIDLTAGANVVPTLDLLTGASILDGTAAEQTDLKIANLGLFAATGIGSTDDLNVAVNKLAFSNKTSGNVHVSDTGGLTIAAVDLVSAGSNLAPGGTVTLSAASPITFAVNTTSAGTITATAAETSPPTPSADNITVNAGVTVQSTGGDVVFLAGDDISVSATAQVSAPNGNIDFRTGFNDNDNEGQMSLNGAVSANAASGTIALNQNSTNSALPAGTTTVSQAATGSLTAAGLLLLNAIVGNNKFGLDLSTTNAIGTIAATTQAPVSFRDGTALTVGSVTSPNEGITSFGMLTTGSDITLGAGGAIAVNQGLNAGTANVRMTSTAGITQTAAGKITAANLGINAGGTVALSTALPLNHVTGTVAINTSSGTVDFTSDAGFTIGAVTAASTFAGASGISAPGNVNATAGGALSVAASTTVNSTSGNVSLKGGGTITVDPTASIKAAAGTATIAANPGIATTFNIPGAALQATSASIIGDTGNDTFNLSPSLTTPINVDGKAPVTTPGDALNLDLTGVTNATLNLTTPPPSMAGSYSFGNRATVTFTSIEALSPIASLSITKSDGISVAIPGTNDTYTVVVTNNGPLSQNNITVADTFPAFLTGVTWSAVFSAGGSGTTSGSGNINQIISLPAGGTAIYTVLAHIASSATGSLVNTASVSSPIPEINTADNSATDTDTLLPMADVQINKTGPANAIAGNNITYQITTTNAGPSDAQTVHTTDTPPAGTSLVSFIQNTGPADGSTLPAGQSETFTLILHINSSVPNGTTLTNTANVSSPTTDTNTSNNSSSVNTLVATQADVSVTKTGPATLNEGQNLVYTITVTNGGISDAQSVNLTDPLPAGTTFVSWQQNTGPSFTLANNAGGVSATIATLAAGSSATFTLTVNVPEEGKVINAAGVTSTTFDPNAGNNNASLTTTVNDAPLTAVGTTILVTEGQVFNNRVVAHFTDANPNPDVLDFSATINWGDGTSSVGTIAENGSGGFDVSGSHQYIEQAANLPVTVTIKDAGGASAIAHSAASIADAPLTPSSFKSINVNEGQPLVSVVLGSFIDADPNGTPADYTVTINWGDGSPTSAGLVTPDGLGFDVSGTHTYAEEGLFLPVITVNDEGGFALGGYTATLNAKVTVGDAPLTANGTPVSAVEGQSVTAQVASFTDANPTAPLSDFSATIDWGDGTPASAGVITQPGGVGKSFVVTGTHTYAEEGNFTVTTSIKDVGGSTATATSTATVADAALTLNPQTLPIMLEGASFTGPIATLFDADPFGTQSDYTVTVDWGDGTSSAGTVGAGGPFLTGSQFQLNGGHTYAEEGLYTLQISVADAGGAKATIFEQALVNDAPLSGIGQVVNGVEGRTFSGPVASFTDADPGGQVGDYISTIDWGDGNIDVGLVKATGSATFDVLGTHTYAEEGAYFITVAVHDAGSHVDINSAITVIDPAVVTTVGAPLASVEGLSTGTAVLATFTDPGGPEVLSDYSASMNWGDATSSPATITFAGGVFTVSGAHTYAEEGNYSTLLTIHHDIAPDATVPGSAVVTDAPLSGTGKILSAVEGAAFKGPVGSFTDANPAPDIADFSATIDWGDGNTTAGTIAPNGSGGFYVNGTHTYDEEAASLPIKIVVKDFGGATTTINSAIAIADAALSGSGVPLAGQQEGNTFSGTVADFTDADPHGAPSDYNATINWGDGTTTDGVIATDGVGGFNVIGSHHYVEEGNYIISTSIKDVGGATTSANTSISISEAPINAIAQNLSLTEGQKFSGLVGGMIDANPFEPPGDYSATIDWGDGSAPSSAVITPTGVPGQFSLSGSHTYAEDGIFAMTLSVKDDGTLLATADGFNTVAESPISASGVNISGLVNTSLSKTVARFTDPANEPLSDYSATIDWGDGSVTSGNVVLSGGSYAVNGNHTYTNPGIYSMTISINDDGTLAATVGATANITAPAAFTGNSGKTFTVWEGNKFNANVAGFTYGNLSANASSFSAKVTWGDGSTTNGTIVKDSAGHFHVMGAHTYAEQGTYATSIKISDSGGHSITAHGTGKVLDAPLTAGTPLTLHLKANQTFSGTIGNFIDHDPMNTIAADYKATINWGDGKTSKATFALTSTGHWKVLGTHKYLAKGTYHLTLTVLDAGASAKLTATVIVG